MNKRLMQQQNSQIKNFLQKEVKEVTIRKAWKYVIDSVHDDKFRLLTSKAKKPIPKKIASKELAKFDLWRAESSEIMETKQAHFERSVYGGIRLKRERCSLRLDDKTFEITEFVRQEVKDHYKLLLEREFTPPEKKEGHKT